MPRRSMKKKLKKVLKEEKKIEKKMTSKSSTSHHHAAHGRPVSQAASRYLGKNFKIAQARVAHNSEYYVRALFDPFSYQGTRIPEPIALPTSTMTMKQTVGVSLVTGSTSGYAGGFYVLPRILNSFGNVTAAVTHDSVTWGGPSDWTQSTLLTSTNSIAHRVVSLGLRLVDAGPLLNRGVYVLAGTLTGHWSATAPESALSTTPVSTFTIMPHFKLLETVDDGNDLEMAWFPLSLSPIAVMANGASSNWEATAATWIQYPGTGTAPLEGLVDNGIVLYAFSTSATAPSDLITVEIVMNVEFIPSNAAQAMFQPAVVEGSKAAVAAGLSEVITQSQKAGTLDWFKAGITKLGSAVWNGGMDILRNIAPQQVNIGLTTGLSAGGGGKFLDRTNGTGYYAARMTVKVGGENKMIQLRTLRGGDASEVYYQVVGPEAKEIALEHGDLMVTAEYAEAYGIPDAHLRLHGVEATTGGDKTYRVMPRPGKSTKKVGEKTQPIATPPVPRTPRPPHDGWSLSP